VGLWDISGKQRHWYWHAQWHNKTMSRPIRRIPSLIPSFLSLWWGFRSIAISVSVCPFAYLKNHTLQYCLNMLPVAVARSSSGVNSDIVVDVPFHITKRKDQIQSRRVCFSPVRLVAALAAKSDVSDSYCWNSENFTVLTICSQRRQTSPPVLPPGELD